MRNIENLIQTIRTYNNGTLLFSLFVAGLILLLAKATSRGRKRMLLLSIFSMVIIFNNISRTIIGKFTSLDTYYRFLWGLPVLIVIAYIAVWEWFEIKEIRYRILMIFFCLFLVTGLGGVTYFSQSNLYWPKDLNRLEDSIAAVCEMIEEHKEMEQPRIAFDNYLQMTVRCQDASILWGIRRIAYIEVLTNGYGQNGKQYASEEILIQVVHSGLQVEPQLLELALEKRKIDYLVISSQFEMDAYLEQIHWNRIDSVAGYTMYGR